MSKTPQQVIKDFMKSLDTHTFSIKDSDLTGTSADAKYKQLSLKMLNKAVTESSNFTSMQDLIDQFIADCKFYNEKNPQSGWWHFLKEKCGIHWDTFESTETEDTGAISGSDANIITDDGETIGSGIFKLPEAVVPEYGNYYEAVTENRAQNIDTGSNDWIIKATANNDTIISGGEDSINAGAGENLITVKGSSVTVDSSLGNDKIFIDSSVKDVTLINFGEDDSTLGNENVSIATVSSSSSDYAGKTSDNPANSDELVESVSTYREFGGDLPGTPGLPKPQPSLMGGGYGDVATNSEDVKVDGVNNYFNTDNVSPLNTPGEAVKVNLTKAVQPQTPVPAGGFIVSDGETDANFVHTNAEAQTGKLVGTVGSVYPETMTFKFKGLTLNVMDRRWVNSDNTRKVIKTFSSFEDVGTDSAGTNSHADTNNAYEKYVVASIYKWWMKEGLALNELDYDYSFEDSDATPLTINLHFDMSEKPSNALATVSYSYYPSTGECA